MRRRLLTVARAEWIHNRRDVRSLIVIIALPVVLLLLYGYGINYDLDHLPFAVWDQDGTVTSRSLVEQFQHTRYFDYRELITRQERIDELMGQRAVVFVLVIPPDLSYRLGAGKTVAVQFILDGSETTRANVALGYLEVALADYSAQVQATYLSREGVTLAPPFEVRNTILYNPDLKSTPFIVPGLIAILLTLLSALLTSTAIVREREWGSFESLIASPASPAEIMIGKLLPYAIIAFADVLLCMVVGRLVFGVAPVGSVALLLLTSATYLLASLAIGLFFSTVARTQQQAILFAMLLTFLPTIILSGFVFPIRTMPLPIQIISQVFPATHFLVVIRSLYLKGAGLAILWPRVLVLLGFTVVLVGLAARRFQKKL
ncbi:MAG TPA: ABC transporter permease [Armatimonadota bacterium]|jgi:ABC-2 type transport system permease protein